MDTQKGQLCMYVCTIMYIVGHRTRSSRLGLSAVENARAVRIGRFLSVARARGARNQVGFERRFVLSSSCRYSE